MMNNTKRKRADEFQARLIRMVSAAGKTLQSHAAEIVGTKTGTTEFDINIHFPLHPDDNYFDGYLGIVPIITVRQSYVSDEALSALKEEIDEMGGQLAKCAANAVPDSVPASDAEALPQFVGGGQND